MTTLSRTSGHGASFNLRMLSRVYPSRHTQSSAYCLMVGSKPWLLEAGVPYQVIEPVLERLKHVLIAEMPLADDGGRVTLLP